MEIKKILKEKGLTQKELSKQSGVSEITISKLVNGNSMPQSETLKKISKVLDDNKSEVLLKAKFGSDKTPLILGDINLPCYVLDNGMRVFSGRGVQNALGSKSTSGSWLNKFINSKTIQMNLTTIISDKLNNPIPFKRNNAGGSQSITYGYEATLLIDLCNAIIDAGGDTNNTMDATYIKNATIIVRAVAKVGIIALVDEATGYNKEKTRAKDELQKFLNSFMSQEASKWVKTFDDNFFETLYKMHNWSWNKTSKRPGVVGKWINDIIYERIAPLVLSALKKANPKNENGNRAYKHHQLLTKEIGLPKLKQHMEAIEAIAKISDYDWVKFMNNLDKAYPKQYQQLNIDFDFEAEN